MSTRNKESEVDKRMKVLKVKLNEDVISRRKQNDKNYKKKKRRKKTSIKRDPI